MLNKIHSNNLILGSAINNSLLSQQENFTNTIHKFYNNSIEKPDEVFIITSYPPRECGIATFTRDLYDALQDKFSNSYTISIGALVVNDEEDTYPTEVKKTLNTNSFASYNELAEWINNNDAIKLVQIQHEFGLYGGEDGCYILELLSNIYKPIVTTMHTILPEPTQSQKKLIQSIAFYSDELVVMTNSSKNILVNNYQISDEKITVIHHGTHLISNQTAKSNQLIDFLKDRIVLATFGLLSSGKSIETGLQAISLLIKEFPTITYLIIGKTHPTVVKNEGEIYRTYLEKLITELHLEKNVVFINEYVSLKHILIYLQRTDIYLFTSKDPNQAVSGTLAYAMSCACPIISTPIPHAKEFLDGAGITFDFQDYNQLAAAINFLLLQPDLRKNMSLNSLHKITPTAWQNVAIAHALLFNKLIYDKEYLLKYNIPPISLLHVKNMTTAIGMIQFAAISTPQLTSGYTLDDNARALLVLTKNYALKGDMMDLKYIQIYLNFIEFCQQADGTFLNYVDENNYFFEKNKLENLEDSNGRAMWALGEFISHKNMFPEALIDQASTVFIKSITHTSNMHSPRALCFLLKGLYHFNSVNQHIKYENIIISIADNLVLKYTDVADNEWKWFEDYLTYANCVLPEALLYAYKLTGNETYKNIAKEAFDFLSATVFNDQKINVISNNGWYIKGQAKQRYGEQPIDVAYTILALDVFYNTFKEISYFKNMEIAFDWFLGKNHLQQIMYNPITGGCYDGLEENYINLNQGAESTLSYLMARLTIEQYIIADNNDFKHNHPSIIDNILNSDIILEQEVVIEI